MVYNQWTQFEDFPRFMDGVDEVRQIDDTHLHWVASFDGSKHEWDAEITEQHPDERVACNTDGKDNAGVVTFHKIATPRRASWSRWTSSPRASRRDRRRHRRPGPPLQGDLERFKAMIESRSAETGAWRGEVARG